MPKRTVLVWQGPGLYIVKEAQDAFYLRFCYPYARVVNALGKTWPCEYINVLDVTRFDEVRELQ